MYAKESITSPKNQAIACMFSYNCNTEQGSHLQGKGFESEIPPRCLAIVGPAL